ncbi:glycoside hydrolase family 88 protein [Klebsiella pneumoniae subsp. pneumoniae]|nr:glycoside hydrolase family 88 protein [Klebsiella pneumoniae subsp. pneumoniae]
MAHHGDPGFSGTGGSPEGNAVRRYLITVLDAQIAALAECRDDSGLWHTLLDDPHSYLEASATAGFGLRHSQSGCASVTSGSTTPGWLKKRFRGIVQNISPQGELLQTSFGTGMGSDLDFYRQIPLTSMPYGQAMAIPLSDGVSTQVLLSRTPRWRGAE